MAKGLKKEYKKQRDRVRKLLTRLEQRGYLYKGYSPKVLLPEIPQRIRRSTINRLAKMTPEAVRKKLTFYDRFTGEVLKGSEGPIRERSEAYRKNMKALNERATANPITDEIEAVDWSDIIIANFRERMDSVFENNPKFGATIRQWLKEVISLYGKQEVSESLEEGEGLGLWPSYDDISDEVVLMAKLKSLLDLIGGAPGYRQDVMDALNNMEEWSDIT